jgi:hypothetical protein
VKPPPSDHERANAARLIVWRRLSEARAIHDRIAAGRAFDWEAQRLVSVISEARAYSRIARALTPRLSRRASAHTYNRANNQGNTET